MGKPYFVYILHESPIAEPYYSKIGFTNNPLRRLDELQAGNPRALRSPDYSRRPRSDFGFRVPTKALAVKLEKRLLAKCKSMGMRFGRDTDHQGVGGESREWVAGLHPDKLWTLAAAEYFEFLKRHGLLPPAP